MFCTNCGSIFEDGNAYCPNCGSKVESVARPVEAPDPVAAPIDSVPVSAQPLSVDPVQATPFETASVSASQYEPAPAPAPAPPTYAVPVTPVQPAYGQPVSVSPVGGTTGEGDSELAKSTMVMGIVAVATACSVFFSIGGIIFGAIGLSKAKKFLEQSGQLFGKAKIGKFLSLGGLIAGSVITAYLALCFLVGIISAIAD